MAQLHVGTMIGIFFRVKQANNGIASQQPIIKILVTIMRIVTAEYNVSVMEINDEFNTNTRN